MDAVDAPVRRALGGHLALISGQEEGRAGCSIRGLDFQQPLLAAKVEGENVKACPVTVFCGDPPDFPGQVRPISFGEAAPLKVYDELLPSLPQRSVPMIPFHRVKLPNQTPEPLRQGRAVRLENRRGNEDLIRRRCLRPCWNPLKNTGVLAEIAVYGVENRVLVVPLWYVTRNPGHAQLIQHR